MTTTYLRAFVLIACSWGVLGGCVTTSQVETPEVESEIPLVDEVGLEDGRTSYTWTKYKGTIPFASQTSQSTAVSGGKSGASVFVTSSRKSKTQKVAKAR
jgi:hypothetical protein